MAYKGEIKSGKNLEVQFQNDLTSAGAALIAMHWTPAGSTLPAGDSVVPVAPGQQRTIFSGKAPGGMQGLKIEVDLPDTKGKGTLDVVREGLAKQTGQFNADDQWAYSVVP